MGFLPSFTGTTKVSPLRKDVTFHIHLIRPLSSTMFSSPFLVFREFIDDQDRPRVKQEKILFRRPSKNRGTPSINKLSINRNGFPGEEDLAIGRIL